MFTLKIFQQLVFQLLTYIPTVGIMDALKQQEYLKMSDETINRFNEITLCDLMAEDLDVWITNNKKFGFDLQIDDENGQTIVDEKGIHPFAMESYADMCRRFLYFYDKLKAKSEEEFNQQLEVA